MLDLIKVIEEAMADEKKDLEHYRYLATQAEDPESRAVFDTLARDEEKHYQVLKDRLLALKLRHHRA